MVDVALHARGGLQRHRDRADDAVNLAAHDHPLGGDGARHLALLADDDLAAADVAFHLAVDLQGALADDLEALADDLEVVADDRLGAGLGRRSGAPLRLRLGLPCGGAFRLGPELLFRGSSFLGSAVELRVNMDSPGASAWCEGRDGSTAPWWNCVGSAESLRAAI